MTHWTEEEFPSGDAGVTRCWASSSLSWESQSWMGFSLWNTSVHHLYFSSPSGFLSPHVAECMAGGTCQLVGRSAKGQSRSPGWHSHHQHHWWAHPNSLSSGHSAPGNLGVDWECGRDPEKRTEEGVGEHEINTRGVSNCAEGFSSTRCPSALSTH